MGDQLKIDSYVIVNKKDLLLDEDAVSIKVEDEGGGPYIAIYDAVTCIRIDFSEWPLINEAVDRLRKDWLNS